MRHGSGRRCRMVTARTVHAVWEVAGGGASDPPPAATGSRKPPQGMRRLRVTGRRFWWVSRRTCVVLRCLRVYASAKVVVKRYPSSARLGAGQSPEAAASPRD